jgi:tetratricopeptide (TPR) repeat protein
MAIAAGMGGAGGGSMPASYPAPGYDPVREYQQGMTDFQAGKFKAAIDHFQNVTDVQPRDASSWYMLGISRSEIGDLKGAERALGKSVKLDTVPVAPHQELALTQAKLKEDGKAGAELATLKSRASTCGDTCPEAVALKAAIAAVEQALGVINPSAASLPLHGDFKFASLDSVASSTARTVNLIEVSRRQS